MRGEGKKKCKGSFYMEISKRDIFSKNMNIKSRFLFPVSIFLYFNYFCFLICFHILKSKLINLRHHSIPACLLFM